VVRENKWRAARYGLDAEIILDDHGSTIRPAREAILDLADDLMPIARKLDCEKELARVEHVLQVGASYERQRAAAAAADGDLRAVVALLVDEMKHGLPA